MYCGATANCQMVSASTQGTVARVNQAMRITAPTRLHVQPVLLIHYRCIHAGYHPLSVAATAHTSALAATLAAPNE